jgi:hypothetical protein
MTRSRGLSVPRYIACRMYSSTLSVAVKRRRGSSCGIIGSILAILRWQNLIYPGNDSKGIQKSIRGQGLRAEVTFRIPQGIAALHATAVLTVRGFGGAWLTRVQVRSPIRSAVCCWYSDPLRYKTPGDLRTIARKVGELPRFPAQWLDPLATSHVKEGCRLLSAPITGFL